MSRRRELVRVGRSDPVPTPYQCLICQSATDLKGGGLCFRCAMEQGGNATSELWCTRCDEKMAARAEQLAKVKAPRSVDPNETVYIGAPE